MSGIDRREALGLALAASAATGLSGVSTAAPVAPPPAVAPPTPNQLREIAREFGLKLSDADLRSFAGLLEANLGAYNALAGMPEGLPPVKYARTAGRKPAGEENKFNAWYVKSRIEGAASGKLKGKTVVLKDNIMLAQVSMMNGAKTLEGYIPDIDATVVTRVLDAGGTILGKAHCEQFCASIGSHTNAAGPVHNPHKYGYSSGGSSSGCAVLVSRGEADMAIGGDQGGSIRVPSAHCGTYGMKPTHGLVPYTGIMPIEPTIDHAGPMTASVKDNALLLEVLAGADGFDPRQCAPKVQPYTELLSGGVKGMRIGILKEGVAHPNSEPAVSAKVQAAAAVFAKMGATVSEVSMPLHPAALVALLPILVEGSLETMMLGDGYGVSRDDLYVTSLMDYHRNWRTRANELSDNVKLFLMLGRHVRKQHGGRFYGKAMNFARVLRGAYDQALAEVDLLLMPTAPAKAQPLPPANAHAK